MGGTASNRGVGVRIREKVKYSCGLVIHTSVESHIWQAGGGGRVGSANRHSYLNLLY